MSTETVEPHSFEAKIECRYLLQAPPHAGDHPLLVLTLHGYGSNPEVMLRLTRTMFGPDPVIASLQAPNAFYTANAPESPVGYSWATSANTQSAVRLHHEMLLQVIRELSERYPGGADRRILVGFSQPVGLNYRFAATYPAAVRGVIGVCGGVPKNWEDGDYGQVTAALLHIARRDDEIFPPAVTEKYADRLRFRAGEVEFQMLDGGHKFPSKGGPIVERWMERIIR
jgi:predicted esterase